MLSLKPVILLLFSLVDHKNVDNFVKLDLAKCEFVNQVQARINVVKENMKYS